VLYDGWTFAREPASPAALHLAALLAHLPAEVEPLLALPEPLPAGLKGLPDGLSPHLRPTRDTPFQRLAWEQILLPGLARRLEVDLVHLAGLNPALISRVPTAAGSTYWEFGPGVGGTGELERGSSFGIRPRVGERIRRALSQSVPPTGLLWPSDLPAPAATTPLQWLPPCVPVGFQPGEPAVQAPGSYILYHGPGDRLSLMRLLAGWSWASPAIGAEFPLLVLGLDPRAQAELRGLLVERGLDESVRCVQAVHTPAEIAALYLGAAVIFHPAPVCAWGDPLLHALACGRPVVAADTPGASARLGPAGYLAPIADPRALGAGLVTCVVEESMAKGLSEAARERAAAWESRKFGERLLDAYKKIRQPD